MGAGVYISAIAVCSGHAALLRVPAAHRRTAHQRIAHVICEVYARQQNLGQTDGLTFLFPVTQAEIADSLGLSTVHVNRVLQDLRRDRLISSLGASTRIDNWERLKEAGDFDPGFLHLRLPLQ